MCAETDKKSFLKTSAFLDMLSSDSEHKRLKKEILWLYLARYAKAPPNEKLWHNSCASAVQKHNSAHDLFLELKRRKKNNSVRLSDFSCGSDKLEHINEMLNVDIPLAFRFGFNPLAMKMLAEPGEMVLGNIHKAIAANVSTAILDMIGMKPERLQLAAEDLMMERLAGKGVDGIKVNVRLKTPASILRKLIRVWVFGPDPRLKAPLSKWAPISESLIAWVADLAHGRAAPLGSMPVNLRQIAVIIPDILGMEIIIDTAGDVQNDRAFYAALQPLIEPLFSSVVFTSDRARRWFHRRLIVSGSGSRWINHTPLEMLVKTKADFLTGNAYYWTHKEIDLWSEYFPQDETEKQKKIRLFRKCEDEEDVSEELFREVKEKY